MLFLESVIADRTFASVYSVHMKAESKRKLKSIIIKDSVFYVK